MLTKRSETEDASDDNILPLESPINTIYILFFCFLTPHLRKSSHFISSTYGKKIPLHSHFSNVPYWIATKAEPHNPTMTLWKPASNLCDLNVHALPCETFFFPSFFQEAMAQKGFLKKQPVTTSFNCINDLRILSHIFQNSREFSPFVCLFVCFQVDLQQISPDLYGSPCWEGRVHFFSEGKKWRKTLD